VAALPVLAGVLGPGSCKADEAGRAPPPPVSAEALLAEHNARIERLAMLCAGGVIELRWTDSRGRHFEQGNLDLWIAPPARLSLRIDKLGEPLFWVGGDAHEVWGFDLLNRGDTVLYRGAADSELPRRLGIPIGPQALLELAGLSPLTAATSAESLPYDREAKAWVVESRGEGHLLRTYFDGRSRLPVRVERQSAAAGQSDGQDGQGVDGIVVIHSDLREYITVAQPGAAPIGLPKVPRLVDVVWNKGESSYRMALSDPVIKAPPQRVFEVDRLAEHLRPDRIERP
jgi:hypothetical protein